MTGRCIDRYLILIVTDSLLPDKPVIPVVNLKLFGVTLNCTDSGIGLQEC